MLVLYYTISIVRIENINPLTKYKKLQSINLVQDCQHKIAQNIISEQGK